MAVVCCSKIHRTLFRPPVQVMRQHAHEPQKCREALEAQQALAKLEFALSCVPASHKSSSQLQANDPRSWQAAWEELRSLETSLHTEMRYIYAPDWDLKPGKLISKKGTWLKPNAKFSWELTDKQKLYLPQGVIMPVLQISKVTDAAELKRHEWVAQHLRVWLKPPIVSSLEARRNCWFVYLPHWEERGIVITAAADTWLKRATSMSGDLQPFELIYVPKGAAINLSRPPAEVDEDWEKFRHQHVHLHRKVLLASPPLTIRKEKHEVFIRQADDPAHPMIK